MVIYLITIMIQYTLGRHRHSHAHSPSAHRRPSGYSPYRGGAPNILSGPTNANPDLPPIADVLAANAAPFSAEPPPTVNSVANALGVDPMTASRAAGLTPSEMAAMGVPMQDISHVSQVQKAFQDEVNASSYRSGLSGEVVGGGVSGRNIGGANSPLSASSNIFHSKLDAAVHESGAYGSSSPLTKNMQSSNDPTVMQRIQESIDHVHDDTLKANVLKEEMYRSQILNRQQRAFAEMAESIKKTASNAAQRDAQSAALRAAALAAKAPMGDVNAVIPGTNRTFGQAIEELHAIAQHAIAHARNPDLYELEHAADEVGSPRPTFGKEILDQAARNRIQNQIREQQEAERENQRRREERKMALKAKAAQMTAEQRMRDAESRAREKQMKLEEEAIQIAEANDSYRRAVAQQAVNNMAAGEAMAAQMPTAGEIKSQIAGMQSPAAQAAVAGEQAFVAAANQAAAQKAIADAATQAALKQDEAVIANIGERVTTAKDLETIAVNLQQQAQARADLAQQKLGEAMVAGANATDIKAAIGANSNLVGAAGEVAVANAAAQRGAELAAAAAGERAVAMDARARGGDLAAAAAAEKMIAAEARARGSTIANAAQQAMKEAEVAAAKHRALAAEAHKEAEVAGAAHEAGAEIASAAAAEEAEQSAEAQAEAAAEAAGFAVTDPYKILGTIPDDAESVSLSNSSIQLPFKTFRPAQAHNQAEAGALAAQNKVKDDIRATVTAEKFDTPLNVIKGEGGFLNVPENAQKVEVESGRAYLSEAAVEAMKKAGEEVGQLEHKINTGERSDMGLGLGYYVADVSGMSIDMPSPSNPTPAMVMTGGGKTLDISQAQGIDIEKGELKLEKWEDYARKVRPQQNAGLLSTGRETILETALDEPCLENALRAADIMFNTKSEVITNPSGETFIKITPPFGVTEQVRLEEAVANLESIKRSCGLMHGQTGVNILQQAGGREDISEAGTSTQKLKTLNIAEGITGVKLTDTMEEQITRKALEIASGETGTHDIITKVNAFDNRVHGDKSMIVEEGTQNIAEELGITKEEVESKGSIVSQIKEEAQEMKAEEEERKEMSMNQQVEGTVSAETAAEEHAISQSETEVVMHLKENLVQSAAAIAKELHMTEEEYKQIVTKVGLKTFSDFFYYMEHPEDVAAIKHYQSARNELRILFGAHIEEFEHIVFQSLSNISGMNDPNQQVLIKKETTFEPKTLFKRTTSNPNGGSTTVIANTMAPMINVVRIPIRTIPNRGLGVLPTKDNPNLPVGDQVLNILSRNGINPTMNPKIAGVFSPQNQRNQLDIIGASKLPANGKKIKLGPNAVVMGTNQEIKDRIDPTSMANITNIHPPAMPIVDPSILGINSNGPNKKPAAVLPQSNNVTEVTVNVSNNGNENCKNGTCNIPMPVSASNIPTTTRTVTESPPPKRINGNKVVKKPNNVSNAKSVNKPDSVVSAKSGRKM